ncbi:unknown [Bacteroides sp. CAG:1060]|nr:unknown [Bacteroides sp. CAG:1060]
MLFRHTASETQSQIRSHFRNLEISIENSSPVLLADFIGRIEHVERIGRHINRRISRNIGIFAINRIYFSLHSVQFRHKRLISTDSRGKELIPHSHIGTGRNMKRTTFKRVELE